MTDADAPAAVAGLNRSDPRGLGLTRVRAGDAVTYLDVGGAVITDSPTLARIRALAIPQGLDGRLDLARSAGPYPGHGRG